MTIREEIGKSLSRLIEAAAKNAIERPMFDNFILSEGSKASQDIASLFADRLEKLYNNHEIISSMYSPAENRAMVLTVGLKNLIDELRQGGQE